MSNDILQLKRDVFGSDSPSASTVAQYFKVLVATAKRLPVSQRDTFAYEILRPFVELDNPSDHDPDLEYIAFQLVGGGLDVLREDGIALLPIGEQERDRQRKVAIWNELIERVDQLPGA